MSSPAPCTGPSYPEEKMNNSIINDRKLHVAMDELGIKKIYQSSGSGFNIFRYNVGWEYYSHLWNNNRLYEFTPSGSFELTDDIMHYKRLENARLTMNGDGRLTIRSEDLIPFRMWLYDNNQIAAGVKNALLAYTGGRRWSDNLEFTFYFNRKNHATVNHSDQGGIFIHLGSDHLFGASNTLDVSSCPFNAHEYILVIQNNGVMYFTGEPYHGSRRDPKPDGIETSDFWNGLGIPLNTNIGIKFIKSVVDNGKSVLLECYRDMTDALNGGHWDRLFQFKHTRGNWYDETMDAPYATSLASTQCVLRPPDHVDEPHYQGGASTCYMVITPVNELDLKWLSCRDIRSQVIGPATTTTDLDESGADSVVCAQG